MWIRKKEPSVFQEGKGSPIGVALPRENLSLVSLIVLGIILRMIYAWGIPPTFDEISIFPIVRRVSFVPGRFFFPFATAETRHPGMLIWLAAIPSTLAGGSVYAIRCFFILLHALGLYGLFRLTKDLFGVRAAFFALALGTIDRYWISASVQVLESSFFFIAPWILYLSWKSVHTPTSSRWMLLGGLFVVGYLYYELALFLAFPLVFLLIATSAGRLNLRRSGGPYLAGFILLACIGLHQFENLQHGGGALSYGSGVLTGGNVWTLSPRFLLLYMGDFLIFFKNTRDILPVLIGEDIYAPWSIPCFSFAGFLYLVCVGVSIIFWRRTEVAFLLFGFFAISVFLSFFRSRGLWNDFSYAGQTIVPAIAITGWQIDRIAVRQRQGRFSVMIIFAVLVIWIVAFLAGPKWGYFTFDWEKSFYGRVYYISAIQDLSSQKMRAKYDSQIESLCREALQTHPDSMTALYALSTMAIANRNEALREIEKGLEIAPDSILVALDRCCILTDMGRTTEARDILRRAAKRLSDDSNMARGNVAPEYEVRISLARSEYAIRNYGAALREALRAREIKPDNVLTYRILFLVYTALGRTHEADQALATLSSLFRSPRQILCLDLARDLITMGRLDRAAPFVEEATRIAPNDLRCDLYGAIVSLGLGDLDRATMRINRVLQRDPTNKGAVEIKKRIDRLRLQAPQKRIPYFSTP